MKISEFRKLIREEVRKVLKEATKTSSNPSEIKNIHALILSIKSFSNCK